MDKRAKLIELLLKYKEDSKDDKGKFFLESWYAGNIIKLFK